jgi:hypothetical protein
MTFGQIKSLLEKNLVESYSNQEVFKKSIKEFKKNILNDRSLSSLYTLYDQLSSPQGLTESEAKDFLNEGIILIQEVLKNTRIPKIASESKFNNYEDIDTLVYNDKIDISERIKSKKKIINTLTKESVLPKKIINLPIKTTIKIAKQTLSSYFENLDEETKKEFLLVISEDTEKLEKKFEDIKSNALDKLFQIKESQEDIELKEKISETIDKVKSEKFDQLNYLKLKNLEKSL